ncbi:MAG TPA: glycosyltransferase family 2 protein [Chromatiaceae bacterium]|nr:glycosyltransferase family 2 protein [Chromatiaceae bacterium]HIN82940.1 glycosyltransferase family 2 protein [Chromatiales bacterium]HIA07613.1 glycosyltransferase family 2 protein [Chromatiaceae bacterium]HIB84133.1 glycosyltransferase family 2 protein [Chromatiaceae bacterium]HIO13824.1 glycosyltransferase family 2 protein [Chromatiales bacterium]
MKPDQHNSTCPMVSVCISTSEWGANIQKAIDSILVQTHWNWEIVVIHNCDRRLTEVVLEQYQRRYFDRIQVVKTDTDRSHETLATGLMHSHGKYLSMLSPTDHMPQRRLANEVAYLESNSKARAVCSVAEHSVEETAVMSGRRRQEVLYRLGDAGNLNLGAQLVGGRSMMVRRKVATDLLVILAHAATPYQMVG